MSSLNELFKGLDSDFVGVDKTEDTTYVYNATDVLVQTTWELPIVIQYPESTVQFEFCSNPGDISFGIVFVAAPEEGQDLNDLEIETVEEMGMVRSNLEAISGSFEVPCEGVLFFMWDNNFDWSATKQISYLIEVTQPAFRFQDKLRVEKCLPLLTETVEDLNAAYVRSADAQDCIEHNCANVSFLEDQLQSLQRKLASRTREKAELDAEIETLEKTVEFAVDITPGLCIRMLDKPILSHVLSYLNPLGSINKVCTLWKDIAEKQRQNSDTEVANRGVIKRSKSEIRSDLAQIRVNVMLRDLSHKQKTAATVGAIGNLNDVSGHNKSGGSHPNSPSRGGEALTVGTVTPAGQSAISLSAASNATTNTAALTGGAGVTTVATSTGTGGVEGSRVAMQGSAPSEKPHNAAVRKPRSKHERLEVSDTSDSDASIPEELPRHVATGRAGGTGQGNMRVSFDNLLPAPDTLAHTASFTTKVTNTLTSPPGKTAARAGTTTAKPSRNPTTTQKQHPSPAVEPTTTMPSSKEVSAFASTLQWGRERPVVATAADGATEKNESNSKIENDTTRTEQADAAPPMIAEAKRKYRMKSTTTTKNMSAEDKHKKSTKQQLESANTKKLLQDVKKVRSEQQITAMVEYLQAGFIKIETLSLEKRRIKKLIKAWNSSFEKKNGRLPTSGERKGHLRELYEEYHQVSLALRIRTEKMDDSLRTVGLTKDEFLSLRDKKLSDWELS